MTLQQTDTQEIKANDFREYRMVLPEYIAVVISGIAFVLLSSSWSSPLFKGCYGYDSSWYSTVGRSILEGYVPYKDLFDLKGPVFFFYEAFGQLFIKGRGGVFLIQCISIVLTSVLLYKSARLFMGRLLSLLVLPFVYYPYIYLLWGGNTVEELFMPLNMAAIYMGLIFLSDLSEETRIKSLLLGVFAGFFVFSKITAGAAVFAVILAVTVRLAVKKEFKRLGECAVFFLAGLFALSLPVFLFFIFRGALGDMLHCVFVLGFKRSTDYYISFSMEWERNLIICPISLVLAFIAKMPKKDEGTEDTKGETGERPGPKELAALRYLIFFTAPVMYVLLHLGSAYTYYFITVIPLWGLCLILSLSFMPSFKAMIKTETAWRLCVMLIALIAVCALYYPAVSHKLTENYYLYTENTEADYVEGCREILSIVPKEERARIYNIESGFKFYEINSLLPNNKYSVNIPYFLHLDRGARTEFMERLIRACPRWIVTEGLDIIDIPEFQEYIARNYDIVSENYYGYLYRRKD